MDLSRVNGFTVVHTVRNLSDKLTTFLHDVSNNENNKHFVETTLIFVDLNNSDPCKQK